MSKNVVIGILGGVCFVLIFLLAVWGICALTGSSYNPFDHAWIIAALFVGGVLGGVANRDS